MTDPPQSQPGRLPGQPDDRTNYQAAGVFAQIASVLVNGFPLAARLLKSLRVGSGAATMAALSGDGLVMADGALAGFYTRDRADSTKYSALYRDATIRLFSSGTGDLWLIDPGTGLITPTVTAVQGGIGFTNSWVNFGNGNDAGYWKDLNGVVHLEGTIKSGTLGTAAFTLPGGFHPLAAKGYPCDSNGAFGELLITTLGVVTPQSGSNVYFILDGVSFRTI